MADSPGALAPFRHRAFAVLWVATVVANSGTWMRDVASAWVMAEIAPAPLMVALVQAAASLPMFLLALPAGALADLFDRRRLLILVQAALGLLSLAFVALAATGGLTPEALLALTLLGGIGSALVAPTWQSIVPSLVPRAELRPAVALNSLGINVSRAIGPALGGFLLAASGPGAAYLADAVSYLFILAALAWWRPAARPLATAPEGIGQSMRGGLAFALASPELGRVLLRAGLFFLFASAPWALLPLLVRQSLGGGPDLYGLLLAAVGAGAILGAFCLPWLRRRLGTEGTMTAASLGLVGVLGSLVVVSSHALAILLLLLCGAAWITALTSLNAIAQGVLPDWVRGRGLAVYLTVFYGAMTLGSLVWGQVASLSSVPLALGLASGTGLALTALGRLRPLPAGEPDLTPSNHWPEPVILAEPGDGPVLVTIRYRVAEPDRSAFLDALSRFSSERRRNGAFDWNLFEDAAVPGQFVETFLEPSWATHLRHHGRVTKADSDLQAEVVRFHQGPERPVVTHLLSRA